MLQYYSVLKSNTLFNGFSSQEFCEILEQLNAHIKSYKKNEVIRHSDTLVSEIGFVIDGLVHLSKESYEGDRIILHELTCAKSFGESLAFTDAKQSPIIVTAASACKILFIKKDKLLKMLGTNSPICSKANANLIRLLAEKVMLLQMKNDILSQKSIREKLLLYFEYERKSAKSNSFKINFKREELADFLSMNVSALSRELSNMRNEGILTFKKNKFVLLD